MPRILVLCPDHAAPSGGIRRLYRHVDVLTHAGVNAAILHQQPGFRCSWFANQTRILDGTTTPFEQDDVLVVPEILGPDSAAIGRGLPKVIFNQNAYLTFAGYSVDPGDRRCPYTHPDVLAAIVVSQDSQEYLGYAFPNLPLFRIHYGIDTTLFAPAARKRALVTFMPRKNAQDVVQVINLLKHRGALAGFDLVAIDGKTEAEVAALQAEALFFLSFGHPEGFGLPPLEALAAGCVVIGYHGRGGREYFQEEFCCPIEAGDVVGFAQAVERMLKLAREVPAALEAMGQRARQYVHANYSMQREEQDIVGIWRTLLGVG